MSPGRSPAEEVKEYDGSPVEIFLMGILFFLSRLLHPGTLCRASEWGPLGTHRRLANRLRVVDNRKGCHLTIGKVVTMDSPMLSVRIVTHFLVTMLMLVALGEMSVHACGPAETAPQACPASDCGHDTTPVDDEHSGESHCCCHHTGCTHVPMAATESAHTFFPPRPESGLPVIHFASSDGPVFGIDQPPQM